MTGTVRGYARTASSERDISLQVDALRAAGCTEIYVDENWSGSKPGHNLARALAELRAGDTLKVCAIDRISRSVQGVMEAQAQLRQGGGNLQIIGQPDEGNVSANFITAHVSAIECKPDRLSDTPSLRRGLYHVGQFLVRLSGV